MMNERKRIAIETIAKELEDNGYTVSIEPDTSMIPFDLQNYRPDIFATNNKENLIVEVKSRSTPRTIERYKHIAETVSKQKNWRFMLTTVDDQYQSEHPVIKSDFDPEALPKILHKLDRLFETESYDLALPYLWSVYISGMRTVGYKHGVPIDVTTDKSVLNYMYSLGEISNEEFEKSLLFLNLRNQLIHTFDIQITKEQAIEIREYVKKKLVDWNLLTLK
ncbi:hypothetical protein QUF72_06040 [Desulfobacterales bacterium HSG2]|nr:hypothetical protein [Desulfobacterales bacterium HSG2]